MDSNGCKQSRSSGKDIISGLPLDIRFCILAKLPRKYAIRTGVLSTDWKDSWKHRFPHQTVLRFSKDTDNAAEQKKFAQEIQKTMSDHGDKKIEIFDLYFCAGKEHENEASQWVEHAVKNGVEDLFLDFAQASFGRYPRRKISTRAAKYELRENLFTHSGNHVTYFSLHYCWLRSTFNFKSFSCLEIIRLQNVNINSSMFWKLMLYCTKLRIVDLKLCRSLKYVMVPHEQMNLKKIVMVDCNGIIEVDISAPKLRSLHFIGRHPIKFLLNHTLQSLSDVVLLSLVELGIFDHGILKNIFMHYYFWFVDVQVLTLSSINLRVVLLYLIAQRLSSSVASSTNLDHLKELNLIMHSMRNIDVQIIFRFFDCCKQPLLLEKLFIENVFAFSYQTSKSRDLSTSDKPWQHNVKKFEHLKTIKISNYKGEDNERILLQCLLNGALNLEIAVVVFDERLFMFPEEMSRELILRTMKMRGSSPNAKIFTCPPYNDDLSFSATHSEVIRKLESSVTIPRDLC